MCPWCNPKKRPKKKKKNINLLFIDYFTYKDMTEKMFYGNALSDKYLNDVTEELRQYLVNGGAGDILKKLGIGLKIVERQFIFSEMNEIVKRRFVFIEGENKGRELTIDEIIAIGMFLKHGAFYGKIC